MSSVINTIKCPKCGYEYAGYIYKCRIGNEHIICARCGYSGSSELDIDASVESGESVWHHKETGGSGSCILKAKGHVWVAVSPIENVPMDELMEELDEFAVFRYTFLKDGQWHIKDVLNNTEEPFNEDDLFDDPNPPSDDRDTCPQDGTLTNDWNTEVKNKTMHKLEVYVVQDAKNKSSVWLFTSKSEAVEKVKEMMNGYIEEAAGEQIQWNWNSEGECTVKLADHEDGMSQHLDDFYYIWKDFVDLSEEDITKLTDDFWGW